ncbi:type 4a pilus biogenesis protein PilO [Candidatus Daviesbacteria bacterium]|nr:type 4a pilus biogenesis protein PilO [Candidatus Daviesbacteria bacterium]
MNPRYSRYYIFVKPIFKNKVVKSYGYFIFSLITITIFALLAIRPTLNTIVSLQKSIAEQQGILKQLDTKTANLSAGKQNLDNLDPDAKNKLSSLLPDYTSLPKLIDNLTTLAVQNEASISGLQFQPVDLLGAPKTLSKDAKPEEIEFTLNSQGSYENLSLFLNSIVTTNRLININSVNFNKPLDSPLSMSINAVAYFLRN